MGHPPEAAIVRTVLAISNPTLSIERVDDQPGQRRVRVDYDVVWTDGDPVPRATVDAVVVVHAVDEHDSPIEPRAAPILSSEETFVATRGTERHCIERVVHRVDLDVDQDWWSTDHGGDPQPIAEWVDHVAADIRLRIAGEIVAQATTETVTGSWGALGDD